MAKPKNCRRASFCAVASHKVPSGVAFSHTKAAVAATLTAATSQYSVE